MDEKQKTLLITLGGEEEVSCDKIHALGISVFRVMKIVRMQNVWKFVLCKIVSAWKGALDILFNLVGNLKLKSKILFIEPHDARKSCGLQLQLPIFLLHSCGFFRLSLYCLARMMGLTKERQEYAKTDCQLDENAARSSFAAFMRRKLACKAHSRC